MERCRASATSVVYSTQHACATSASLQVTRLGHAGDIQSEIQYATKESPLGRESYGLMMLVNVMVPVLEHGLRPDWKSILPAATVTTSSAQWLQNLAQKARSGKPTVFDMLQVRSLSALRVPCSLMYTQSCVRLRTANVPQSHGLQSPL